jgi:hypothetical protein
VTFVAEDLPKRHHVSTFRACAVLTALQPLSEPATVRDSICDKIAGPWLQNQGCKVSMALTMPVDCVFDSHAWFRPPSFSRHGPTWPTSNFAAMSFFEKKKMDLILAFFSAKI